MTAIRKKKIRIAVLWIHLRFLKFAKMATGTVDKLTYPQRWNMYVCVYIYICISMYNLLYRCSSVDVGLDMVVDMDRAMSIGINIDTNMDENVIYVEQ